MHIKKADFLKGAWSIKDFPPEDRPEIGFVGKSNVGKSSIINSLLQRRRLAKTASAPGKTRQINFYPVNDAFYLVDLPGYGKALGASEGEWKHLIEGYLEGRKKLLGVVFLLDIRHAPGALDEVMLQYLQTLQLNFLLVANKVDKLNRKEKEAWKKHWGKGKFKNFPLPLVYSSQKHVGREELWASLEAWF